MIFEQGDVLLFAEKIPDVELEDLKSEIVEHGEHTGHAHRLSGDGFTHYINPKTKDRYLRIVRETTISHEEHAPFTLPPGDYRIGRVREKGMFDDLIAPVVD